MARWSSTHDARSHALVCNYMVQKEKGKIERTRHPCDDATNQDLRGFRGVWTVLAPGKGVVFGRRQCMCLNVAFNGIVRCWKSIMADLPGRYSPSQRIMLFRFMFVEDADWHQLWWYSIWDLYLGIIFYTGRSTATCDILDPSLVYHLHQQRRINIGSGG